MKISAVIISKDEEKTISRCIKSLSGIDEIVVLDTGSKDKTVEIARSLGAVVTLQPVPISPFHFANARNEANTLATGGWNFSIDCDEVLRSGSVRKMHRAIEEGDAMAFTNTFVNHAEGDASRTVSTQKIKLYKALAWTWKYRVHEQLFPVDPAAKVGDLASVVVEHLPVPDKSKRHRQNIDLLKMCILENPEYTRAFKHLGQELMIRKEWLEAIPYLAQYAEQTQEGPLHKSEVLMHVGRCYSELGRLEEGLKWFDLASLTDTRRREPLYHAGLNLIKASRLDEALVYVKKMMAIPVAVRPMSHLDLPDVWAGTPIKMLSFCMAEIARAKRLASKNT